MSLYPQNTVFTERFYFIQLVYVAVCLSTQVIASLIFFDDTALLQGTFSFQWVWNKCFFLCCDWKFGCIIYDILLRKSEYETHSHSKFKKSIHCCILEDSVKWYQHIGWQQIHVDYSLHIVLISGTGNKLCIIMDLIEGAPLNEHFSSLKEKGNYFTETRIWSILIQMLLALRYLHKDKGIVHRDLTPNNIMLGENDKVTISKYQVTYLLFNSIQFKNYLKMVTQ